VLKWINSFPGNPTLKEPLPRVAKEKEEVKQSFNSTNENKE
jgi:hypothetical protein